MEGYTYKCLDLSVGVTQKELEDGAFKILQEVRPDWHSGNVKIKTFTGGISNSLIGCYEKDKKFSEADIVLIRVYGENTELIIDRENEKQTFFFLEKFNLSPPLYASFNNGLCYGFFHGTPIDMQLVRYDNIQRLFIDELVNLHSLSLDSKVDNGPQLFPVIRKYLKQVPENFKDTEKQKRYLEHKKPKAALYSELDELEDTLRCLTSPVVFCHNDLLLNNIIYDGENEKVKFIDYEYASTNYQAYDIANHFCEYAGIDETDYNNYPDKSYQLNWLRCYLECWNKKQGFSDKCVTDTEVETLYVTVNKFALASHFLWGVWAIVQANNSLIDFDFLGEASAEICRPSVISSPKSPYSLRSAHTQLSYSIIRLDEYFAKKKVFLSLEAPH